MEQSEVLALKMDSLVEAIRANNDLGRQTLDEVKRMNSAIELQVAHLKEEDGRIWGELHEFRNTRKNIYERLEKIEQAYAVEHGLRTDRHGISFDSQATAFINSAIGRVVTWGAMLAIGALISKLIQGL